jgi:hypothetical protein
MRVAQSASVFSSSSRPRRSAAPFMPPFFLMKKSHSSGVVKFVRMFGMPS